MKTRRLRITLTTGLGFTLTLGLFAIISRARPGNPVLDPPRNSHAVPLTTTVSITYDEPISATTVTSHTFAVHAMQSGLMTETHGVVNGNTIIVTPTLPFHQGELVYAIATTRTLNITGTGPLSATQWQFNAGKVISRCMGNFINVPTGLSGVRLGSAVWGDYDNDEDIDILLSGLDASYTPIAKLYRNDGGGAFTEVSTGLTEVYNSSVAWGDYDNDGDLDILLSGRSGSFANTNVYRNDGGNTFTDIYADMIWMYDSSAAWGDYDNDGDLDVLLSGDSVSGFIARVYRNDGGDTFTNISAGLTGVYGGSVAWGDYDNDGDLDILLAGYSTSSGRVAQVYRNDGGGTFTDISAGLIGVEGGSAVWGDYDNDGDLDILLAGYSSSGRIAQVYRNDGGGTFTDISAGLIGVEEGSAVWGDYDNDGDLDILLTGLDASYIPVAKVYRNDGGGVFVDISASLTGVYNSSVAWGDYDNDGDLDILLSGFDGTNPVARVYRNTDCAADLALVKTVTPLTAVPGEPITYTITFYNAGNITATGVIITDNVPVSVTNTSVISNGISITQTNPGYVWSVQDLLPGEGGIITITGVLSESLPGKTFTNAATISTASFDVNLNNNTDYAPLTVYLLHVTAVAPPVNAVSAPLATTIAATLDGDLEAGTATSNTFAIHGMQSGLVTGTFDYDSLARTLILTPTHPLHAGEIVRTSATSGLLRTDGEPLQPYQWQFHAGEVVPRCVSGFTSIPTNLIDIFDGSVAWGDYDDDGDLDILLSGHTGSTGVTKIYRNEGAGTFTTTSASLAGVYGSSVAWGDYDNDGDLDVLLSGNNTTRIYRNDTGDSFTNISAGLPGMHTGSVAWGDYDNDGDLDVLLAGRDVLNTPIARVYRNDGNDEFTNISASLTGVEESSVAWGDYDNDGDLDILLAGNTTYWPPDPITKIYRNDGEDTFVEIITNLPGVYRGSVAWGDYDNDGDLDILLSGSLARVYRNDGGGAFTDISAGLSGVIDSSVAWGDYDNDGDLDILLTGFGPIAWIYRNDGEDTFTRLFTDLSGVGNSSVAWGDYDNDGDLDILLTGRLSGSSPYDPTTQVYRNDGCPDLRIIKSVIPPIAAPGDTITYTLDFSNSGAFTATHVVITDKVPISLTNTSVISSGVAITQISPSYVWNVQDMSPGAGGIITITAVLSSSLATGPFTNTATITLTTMDQDAGNNYGEAVLTVVSPAEITVAPLSLDFGSQGVNAGPTPSQTVTITSEGTMDLHVTSVSLTGTDAIQFSVSDSGESPLAPGSTRTIAVSFDPSSVGGKSASLVIVSDDPDESTVTVALSGIGIEYHIFLPLTLKNHQ